MAGCSGSIRIRRHQELVIATVTLMVVLTQVLMVASLYIPDEPIRRSDSDEDDELDSRASAPYQNQGNENSAPATDGFDDNEQEGSYDETPNDEGSQADLEKFFDDHLGASERDGMDKENLPTNVVPIVIQVPQMSPSEGREFRGLVDEFGQQNENQFVGQQIVAGSPRGAYDGLASQPTMSYLEQNPQLPPNNVETSYIRLPNKRLIITRQITRGPIYKGGMDDNFPPIPSHILQLQGRSPNQEKDPKQQTQEELQRQQQQQVSSRFDEEPNAKGSDIVRTEDDDMDPVYVTSLTKPFKIDALGGFDPEEDFRDATRDLEEPAKKKPASGERRRSSEQDYQETKDISFNDPEADTLFNDASETDEVIFGHDPYQTDLEAEMSGQSATETPEEGSDAAGADEAEDGGSSGEQVAPRSGGDDDSESNWVNDGVDDMDVPSQSYQDSILEKAALQDAARRAAEEAPSEDEAKQQGQDQEQEQQQQPETEQADGESQRMPNADYLKDDLTGMDDIEDKAR